MIQEKYYRTISLELAVFLYVNYEQIAGINTVDSNQKEFAFVITPKLQELVHIYKFGDRDDDRLLVNVFEYTQARREILNKLND